MRRYLMATALTSCLLLFTACQPGTNEAAPPDEAAVVEQPAAPEEVAAEVLQIDAGALLDAALAAQDDAAKARYADRNPKETLAFFGIEPGMTVAEVLPGGGWYSKILLPYLGADGKLVGIDYSLEMWPLFGGFATEEFLEARKTWAETWRADAEGWRGEGSASVDAIVYGSVPEEMHGSLDAILMIRALHHFNRFEEEGGFWTQAAADTMALLKPGGIVGIVQHRGPEENDDVWAEGDNGYMKQSQVIALMEAAGFELVDQSEINANPKDQPTNEDMVWRLPPTLGTSRDNEELRAEMTAIGESDRMTLKFRKPM